MEIIRAEDVRYSYPSEDGNKIMVLNGVNLVVEKGTFIAILGRNGSGKSTLAKHFNGILLPEGGSVYVEGMDTRDDALLLEIRRRIGMVFQNPDNQIVANVVEEDVAFAPENLGCPPEEIRRRVDRALKLVGMYEYRERAPHTLSGGQKQRVAIAGALAMDPECIVFDEPTAMLDPKGRADVIRIIERLREEQHTTVILITHHMEEAVRADRVVILADGKVALDGTPAEIFSQVELLRSMGLTVPETTNLLYELNRRGFRLSLDALSPDNCAKEIYQALVGAGASSSETHP